MRVKRGRKGAIALKIDLEKAYDWLIWNFIEDTLHDIGIPSDLVKLIMFYITTNSF